MTYVILQHCCNDAACVPACPVDCIHPRPDERAYATTEMLYVDPEVCIDCGACREVCPVDAIRSDYDLRPDQIPFLALNKAFYSHKPIAPRTSAPVSSVPTNLHGTRDLRVAIVGSGPAGFYAAQELLSRRDAAVHVDMFERLTTPGGLVRFGVAPDHLATKAVAKGFEQLNDDPRFKLWLNVDVGSDISDEQLAERYHAVIYAFGAMDAQKMGIPGEELTGSHSASEFVAWYNGHPDYAQRTFDLSVTRAVVIGNGNVALDIARILLSAWAELVQSDIAQHAFEQLLESGIREVVIVGRRGPAEAAFTNGELMGLLNMPGIDILVDPDRFDLTPYADTVLDFAATQKIARLTDLAERATPSHDRRIVFRFCESPEEILGDSRVSGIRLRRNALVADGQNFRAIQTDAYEELDCGLVIRSVGYRGNPLGSVPFDTVRGIIPNRRGRVVDGESNEVTSGKYVTGWIKRGPSGVIGTNKQCAKETVAALVEDFHAGNLFEPAVDSSPVSSLVTKALDVRGWKAIDEYERREGARLGRPRVKLVDRVTLLEVAEQAMEETMGKTTGGLS